MFEGSTSPLNAFNFSYPAVLKIPEYFRDFSDLAILNSQKKKKIQNLYSAGKDLENTNKVFFGIFFSPDLAKNCAPNFNVHALLVISDNVGLFLLLYIALHL